MRRGSPLKGGMMPFLNIPVLKVLLHNLWRKSLIELVLVGNANVGETRL